MVIKETERGLPLLIASQSGERRPLTDRAIVACSDRGPFHDVQGFPRHSSGSASAVAERCASVHAGAEAVPRANGDSGMSTMATKQETPTISEGAIGRRIADYADERGLALAVGLAGKLNCGSLELHLPDGGRQLFSGQQPGPHGVLHLRSGRVARRYLTGGSLGFAESYIDGDWDSTRSRDAAGAAQPQRACLGRRVFRRPVAPLAAPGAASAAAEHARRQPAQHRRPLRPRQRLLRRLARPDDDLLLRAVRRRRGRSRGGAARQVPQSRPEIAARARPDGARDRLRLGRLRRHRGEGIRRQGDRDHDLAARSTSIARADLPRRA